MNRKEILETVEQIICKDRQDIHGNPENSFAVIAALWQGYLQIEVRPQDVAVLMALFKVARFRINPAHTDNFLDGCGYFAIAGELSTLNKH